MNRQRTVSSILLMREKKIQLYYYIKYCIVQYINKENQLLVRFSNF